MYNQGQHIHFIGIGGVGMAGIAEILVTLGYSVSGSDIRANGLIEHLQSLGVQVSISHAEENLPQKTTVVVTSTAIPDSNPELHHARERGLIVIPRAEMLAELMRMKYGIAIGGSHGKTTTTSLTGHVLRNCELEPTVIVGGRVLTKRSGARLGAGPYLVAEADESDGSFSFLRPAIAVVTNIDSEHLSHYGSFGALEDSFQQFMSSVPFYGAVIACTDDPVVAKLTQKLTRRVISYGFNPESHYRAKNVVINRGQSRFDIEVNGTETISTSLPVPGRHMVQNALASIAVAVELGVGIEAGCEALKSFTGVARRSEILYQDQGLLVIDDYAHHPTEIKATLRAIKSSWLSDTNQGRLFVLFQPHRYSRTKELFNEFVTAFSDADKLYVSDIYPAGEEPLPGVSAKALVDAVQHGSAAHVEDLDTARELLLRELKSGDIFVTLGAGNVGSVAHAVADILKESNTTQKVANAIH